MTLKAFVFSAVLAVPAIASPFVTFATSGTIACVACGGSGTSTATFGTGALAFIPGGGALDLSVINPSNANFGQIQATGFTSLAPINGTLTLTITQTVPTGDSGDFIGTLTGGIVFNASNGHLLFTTSSVVLAGDVTYTVSQPVNGLLIVPPSTHNGITTIEGTVGAPVPEPGTWGLLLSGGALIAIGRARRNRD